MKYIIGALLFVLTLFFGGLFMLAGVDLLAAAVQGLAFASGVLVWADSAARNKKSKRRS